MSAAAVRTLPPAARGFSPRAVLTILLLVAGAVFARKVGGRVWFDPAHALILKVMAVATVGVLAVAPIRRRAVAAMDLLRHPSPGARRTIAVVVAVAGGIYLYAAAAGNGRHFRPVVHDEYCYLVQARALAEGHLWMPRHELAGHFDSFHLIGDPAYAAKYGPGSALFFAPPLAAGLPYWVGPVVLSAAAIGLAYLVMTHLIDGLAGLLAVLMLPTFYAFRRVSIEALSQAPMMFLALLAFWAYVHWRRNRSPIWLAVVAAAVGWAAITRPADAAALGLTLGVALLVGLRGAAPKEWGATTLVGLAAVAPFLALQVAYNRGVTGSSARLPWNYYAEHNDRFDRLLVSQPTLSNPAELSTQKVRFTEEFTRKHYEEQAAIPLATRLWRGRVLATLENVTPHGLLLALVPLGVVGLLTRGRWPVLMFLGTFLLVYAQYPFYLGHYMVVAAVPCFLLMLAGWDVLADGVPRGAGAVRLASGVAVFGLVTISLPDLQRVRVNDEWRTAPAPREYDDRLAAVAGRPAIVLFRFDPATSNPHVEPVYNVETAWPDDARVIRAHDLGDVDNARLFAYYAARQPERRVYRYDRAKLAAANPLRYLGTARELATRAQGVEDR